MNFQHLVTTVSITAFSLFGAAAPAFSQLSISWSGGHRATDVCVGIVRDRGLPLLDIISQNDYSGGTEVVLRVLQGSDRVTIACNYPGDIDQVRFYRVESFGGNWRPIYDDYWDHWRQYSDRREDYRQGERWDNRWNSRRRDERYDWHDNQRNDNRWGSGGRDRRDDYQRQGWGNGQHDTYRQDGNSGNDDWRNHPRR